VGSLPRATGGDLLHHGPPWTAGGQPASPWSSSQAAREDSAPASRSPPPPPSSLTLVSAGLFLSHSRTPLSRLLPPCSFSPLLKHVITEALPPLLIGLALASQQVCLRSGWCWLYQTRGKLLAASHRSQPYSPPDTKTLPCKPVTLSQSTHTQPFFRGTCSVYYLKSQMAFFSYPQVFISVFKYLHHQVSDLPLPCHSRPEKVGNNKLKQVY